MTTIAIKTSKLIAAAGVAAILAFTSGTPSRATNSNDGGPFIFGHAGHSSVSSNNRSSAYRARAQANPRSGKPSYRRVPADDPPGSAFQNWGNRQELGCPC